MVTHHTARAKPRVLFVGFHFGMFGGLEKYSRDLAKGLQALGFLVDAWGVLDAGVESLDGIEVCSLAPPLLMGHSLTRRVYYHLWERFLQRKLARQAARYDLIIAGHIQVLPTIAGTPGHSQRWVCTYGNDVWGKWSPQVRTALLRCDRILTISNYTRDSIVRRLPSAPISMLAPVIDVDRFVPAPSRHRSEVCLRLLTVSRLARGTQKGHDRVIRCLPELNRRLAKPIQYQIVGTGPHRTRLERLAVELGVRGQLDFLGFLPQPELVKTYQNCDVFVMPGRVVQQPNGHWRGEGFGIVYAEASACARPVVSSNEGGVTDAVLDGVTGFCVDPNSLEAVTDAIHRILSDPELATRMGQAGREYVVRNFSRPVFERRLAGVLCESGLLHSVQNAISL